MGGYLRYLRSTAGWTQAELSAYTDGEVSDGMIALVETGRRNLSPESAERLADALDLDDEERATLVRLVAEHRKERKKSTEARLQMLERFREEMGKRESEHDRHHLDMLSREFAAFRDDVTARLDAIEGALFGPGIHAQAATGGKAGEVIEDHGPARGRVGTFDPDEEGGDG